MNEIDVMIEKLNLAKVEYFKLFEKNNKSAATRLRKHLQDITTDCKDLRNKALDHKKTI